MAGGGEGLSLENTPTYAAATAVALFIGVSLLVERQIRRLKKYLKKKDQKPLRKVVDKLTDELMLLGFISLLLTVLQDQLTKICVTNDFVSHMLPCKGEEDKVKETPDAAAHRRLLASLIDAYDSRRILASKSDYCARKGKAPFVSLEGLHQLHIFIFVLGFTHVTYSLLSVLLGFVRMYHWKVWEAESREIAQKGEISIRADLEQRVCDKISGNGGRGSCSFLNSHIRRYENPITLWTLCFFQQFAASVSREDYLLFRVGFISSFGLSESFNFREYVMRSMEMDFKSVTGISWWLWIFVVLFLLVNVDGWYTYFWASFIPTILVLIVGTKQQHIISVLALQAKRHAQDVLNSKNGQNDTEGQVEMRSNGTEGNDSDEQVATRAKDKQVAQRAKDIGDAVKLSNDLFWFQKPRFLLRLIHFVIFQNSFELAILFWILVMFGWNSCMLGHHTLVIIRIAVGAVTIFLSSYNVIPIYALVTQMGSHMKMEAVLGKRAARGVSSLIAKVKVKKSNRGENGSPPNEARVDPITEDAPHTPDLRTRIEEAGVRRFQQLYGKQKGLERLRSYKVEHKQPESSDS
ncbi:hypothetical protein R1sor_006956 [Riccia sorocarpa]|uniref:MLO-like protein n=1 Tax=Riccia sorocarpa TaxID=122646 RepID=A0ABD3HT89_9MARC